MAARRHGKRPPKVLRMSVELPLWRALTGYRILTLVYTLCLVALSYRQYDHPLGAAAYMGVLTVWMVLTWRCTTSAERCTRQFLVADLGFAIGGILLTLVVDSHARIMDGGPTLPSIWTAGAVLGFAIKGGWRWAAVASTIVAVANLVERQELARDTIHNVVLVWVASVGLGYVVEVARSSERTLARALQIEAATRERERLARDIHDSVLQVLAMVQRRGAEIGGEATELGRMAGEQEVALRTLVAGGLVSPPGIRFGGAASTVPHPAGEGGRERTRGARRDRCGVGRRRAVRCPGAARAVRGGRCHLLRARRPGHAAGRRGGRTRGRCQCRVGQCTGACGGRGPRMDPGGGRTACGDRDGPRRRPRHPRGPARGRRARGPSGGGPVDPRAAARPGRQRGVGLGPRPGHGSGVDGPQGRRARGWKTGEGLSVNEQGLKVMVVDDHPMWRDAVARDLAEAGCEVVATAGDGLQAVRRAQAAGPDVLVLDLNLPGLPGVAVCKELVGANPALRVLVLSASGEHADVLEAVKSGATGYLLKSASTEELLDAVRRTAAGDAVFTPGLAGLVLGEYRRLATEPAPATPDEPGAPQLTDRETEVLRLVAKGLSYKQIAERLVISHRTVQNHVQNTLGKLQLHNRVELVRYAIERGLDEA